VSGTRHLNPRHPRITGSKHPAEEPVPQHTHDRVDWDVLGVDVLDRCIAVLAHRAGVEPFHRGGVLRLLAAVGGHDDLDSCAPLKLPGDARGVLLGLGRTGQELVEDGHLVGADPAAGDPHDLLAVGRAFQVDLVGEERAAGGFAPDQIEYPVADARAVGEPECGCGVCGLPAEQGVFDEAAVFGDPVARSRLSCDRRSRAARKAPRARRVRLHRAGGRGLRGRCRGVRPWWPR